MSGYTPPPLHRAQPLLVCCLTVNSRRHLRLTDRRPHRTTASPPPNRYTPYSRPSVPSTQAPSQPPPDNHPPSAPYSSNSTSNLHAQHQQQQQQQQRPISYAPSNNPQELATSVYDSPIAPHNPQAGPYSHSPDDEPSAPSYAPPGVPEAVHPAQPSGTPYDARQSLPSQSGGGGAQYKAYVPPNPAY